MTDYANYTNSERLYALAENIAASNGLTLPHYSSSSVYPKETYARPFMIASMYDDPTDSDDGYGCRQIGNTEWAETPDHAAHLVRGMMEWKGWRRIVIWDVERGEKCPIEIGVAITYNALKKCVVVAKPQYMHDAGSGDAPTLQTEK